MNNIKEGNQIELKLAIINSSINNMHVILCVHV